MFLLSKSENLKIFTPNTHAWPVFRNSKVSGGAVKEKISMWGMDLFSKKTTSEKSLITKYALRNILPANADC